jgi:hypothetical protein
MDPLIEHKGFLGEIQTLEHWGYDIYRTVYTPESDEKWEAAIAKIDSYVKADLYGQNPDVERKELSDTILAKYRNTIIQDPAVFDQASQDSLRTHFLQRLADNGKRLGSYGPENRLFIMLDEETLKIITTASDDPLDAVPCGAEWQEHRVKVVDAVWNPNPPPPVPGRGRPSRGPSAYKGWMYLTLYRVWFFSHRVFRDADISM